MLISPLKCKILPSFSVENYFFHLIIFLDHCDTNTGLGSHRSSVDLGTQCAKSGVSSDAEEEKGKIVLFWTWNQLRSKKNRLNIVQHRLVRTFIGNNNVKTPKSDVMLYWSDFRQNLLLWFTYLVLSNKYQPTVWKNLFEHLYYLMFNAWWNTLVKFVKICHIFGSIFLGNFIRHFPLISEAWNHIRESKFDVTFGWFIFSFLT